MIPVSGVNAGRSRTNKENKGKVIEMSPSEKAIITRRKNEAIRRGKEEERELIRKKMTDTCLNVLDDPSATSADRIKAVEILHNLSEGRWRHG